MSEMKRFKENIDYEDIWNRLKNLIDNLGCDPEIKDNEKKIYQSLLLLMHQLEMESGKNE